MILSVIIPMYNEENTVEQTAKALLDRLSASDCDFEIIFSDDGSTDRSAEKVSAISEQAPEVRLVRSEVNKGKGHAIRLGIAESRGQYAVFTDCDLAYGTDVILQILEVLQKSGAPICIGSRALHPQGYAIYPPSRRIISEIYIKIIKRTASFAYSDSQCGIKGFSLSDCAPLFEKCVIDGFAFDLELLMLADSEGLEVRQLPVRVLAHDPKSSKVRAFRDAMKMLRDLRVIKKDIRYPRKERITDEA